jgi:hypothetical protein
MDSNCDSSLRPGGREGWEQRCLQVSISCTQLSPRFSSPVPLSGIHWNVWPTHGRNANYCGISREARAKECLREGPLGMRGPGSRSLELEISTRDTSRSVRKTVWESGCHPNTDSAPTLLRYGNKQNRQKNFWSFQSTERWGWEKKNKYTPGIVGDGEYCRGK